MPPDSSPNNQGGNPRETGVDSEQNDHEAPGANPRPRFTHFFFSIRPAHTFAQKASASAIRNLVRVPAKDIEEGDANCAICYEPMVDYDEPLKGDDRGQSEDPSDQAPPENSAAAPGSPTLNPDDHSGAALPCKHIFGRSCLHSWLKKAPSCPICRARVESENGDEESAFQLMDLNFDVIFPESDNAAIDIREMFHDRRIAFPNAWRFGRWEGEEPAESAGVSGTDGLGNNAPAAQSQPQPRPQPQPQSQPQTQPPLYSQHSSQSEPQPQPQPHDAHIHQRDAAELSSEDAEELDAQLERLREAWDRAGEAHAAVDYMNLFLRTEASVRVATLRRRLRLNRQRQMAAQDQRQRDAQSGIYLNIIQRLMNHRQEPQPAAAEQPAPPAARPATAESSEPGPTPPSSAPVAEPAGAPADASADTPMADADQGPRRLGPRRRELPRRNPYSR